MLVTPRTLLSIPVQYRIFDLTLGDNTTVQVKTPLSDYTSESTDKPVDCIVQPDTNIEINLTLNVTPLAKFAKPNLGASQIKVAVSYPTLIRITSGKVEVFYMGTKE